MPWTLSHPLAVLPLRRLTPQPFDFAALVFGSMTPDFGYYINCFDLSNLAHTLPGSFIVCLPTGVMLMLVYYLICRPVCYALPAPHRQVLLPLCPAFPTSVRLWGSILFSLLLGAWTHNFWDAFTHEHGWFVDRIPWLQVPIMHFTNVTLYRYLALQEISTIAGFLILVLLYWRWLWRQKPVPTSESDGWRYLFWTAILGLALIIALPAAIHSARIAARPGFLFGRSFLFRVAIYTPGVAIPLSLTGAAIIYARRDRR